MHRRKPSSHDHEEDRSHSLPALIRLVLAADLGGSAAMLYLDATVTVHRVGVLDLSSLTDRIIPMTRKPFKTTAANSPRYKA